MNKDRFNTYMKIIQNNEYIESMYNKLSELDFQGKKMNDEYQVIIELIKDYANQNEKLYKRYSLHDKEGLTIKSLISDIANYPYSEVVIYLSKLVSIKNKRFISFFEHLSSESSIHNKNDIIKHIDNDLINEYDQSLININGVNYTIQNLTDIYSELNYNDFVNKMKNIRNHVEEGLYKKMNVENRITSVLSGLENHTFLKYIDIEIEKSNDLRIKKKLIDAKYTFISLFKNLEDSFLKDPNNYSRVDFYLKSYKNMDIKNDFYGIQYNQSILNELNNFIIYFLDRNKINYNNKNDEFMDLINILYMKTLNSLIMDASDMEELFITEKELLQENNSLLNNIIFMKANDLDPNLILSRKL